MGAQSLRRDFRRGFGVGALEAAFALLRVDSPRVFRYHLAAERTHGQADAELREFLAYAGLRRGVNEITRRADT